MDELHSIRRLGRNEFTVRELVKQVKSSLGILPFVGAGLSIPFGYKGWQQFLISQGKAAGIAKQVRSRIRKGEYEEAAQDLLGALTPRLFQDLLLQEYGDDKLEGIELNGAVSLLPRLVSGPVITTNFDHVLERAFFAAKAPFEDVLWGNRSQQGMEAYYRNQRYLLKLHGDIKDRTERVLTLSEYKRHYGTRDPSRVTFKKPLPKLLRNFLNGRIVLFLGCSLQYDRVVKILRRIADDNPDVNHYAVVEYPGLRRLPAAERYFAAHAIRPIWYPNHDHTFVELIVKFLLESTADRVPPKIVHRERKSMISTGMKATEALEILIQRHPDIVSFFLVRYKDKPRLAERAEVGVTENPELYLAQAAVHNDENDQEEEVPRTKLNQEFWLAQFEAVRAPFVLAISSRVKLKDGTIAHIPMMDFKCAPTSENVNVAKEGFKQIDQEHGVLLNSGKSFHYYGDTLMSDGQWRAFLGHSLLLSEFIDDRYIGHALINNECRLRISTTRLNPFIPTVVDVF